MKILIIDDEKSIRYSMRDIIEYEGHSVEEAVDGKNGLDMILKNEYDLVFCDIKMPKMDGIEVLSKSMEGKELNFCMISGHGTIETAVECLKKGAIDYIEKPIDLNKLISILNENSPSTVIERNENNKINKAKVSKDKSNNNVFDSIIGQSKPMKEMFGFIEKVGLTDARVLVTGENGTGKELVAKALHQISQRKNNVFIEVNCAAIPSELIESELFGHEKGAFTSAIKQRKGNFEQADDGTLFLDEIGDMSLSAQAKVLRALQENKINRVGGDKDISVNVRMVAATNKDLREEINQNRFREDLFHRLSVILIHVPSLNERTDDIPILTQHFVNQLVAEQGLLRKEFTPEAIKALQQANWTGNIRELRNIIERLLILGGKEISADDVKTFANPAVK